VTEFKGIRKVLWKIFKNDYRVTPKDITELQKPEDTEVPDVPQLDERKYFLEVGNRPMASYTFEEEEDEEEIFILYVLVFVFLHHVVL
jgi:hypothetical protein